MTMESKIKAVRRRLALEDLLKRRAARGAANECRCNTPDSDGITPAQFRAHVEADAREVASWPDWMKGGPSPASIRASRNTGWDTNVEPKMSSCPIPKRLSCSKCSFQGIQGPMYCNGFGCSHVTGGTEEHLVYTCRQCGYKWAAPTADAKSKAKK